MSTQAVTTLGAIERSLVGGDLSQLTETERLTFYKALCESLGLNPLTKPFEYIELNGKLTLYAKRDCTDQLRKLQGISVKILSREVVDGIYVVTSQARTAEGREDESVGAVPIVKEGGHWKTAQGGKRFFEGTGEYVPLKPEDKANAIMKAETKSKRRVTLSICGLGLLDESELDTIAEVRARQQAAQDAVVDRKLAEASTQQTLPIATSEAAPTTKPLPASLVPKFNAWAVAGLNPLIEGLKEVKTLLISKMPQNGADEYKRVLSEHGIKEKGQNDNALLRAALTHLWELQEQVPYQKQGIREFAQWSEAPDAMDCLGQIRVAGVLYEANAERTAFNKVEESNGGK